jgi:hypothetical protein
MTRRTNFRRILFTSCGLLLAVGLVLAVGVIPLFKRDVWPRATPDQAIVACWFIAGANLFAALVHGRTALRPKPSGWSWRILTGLMAGLTLLFALALTDGAIAALGHGPEVRFLPPLMFLSAGGNLLAGVLALIAAFLRPEGETNAAGCSNPFRSAEPS